MCGIAGYIGHNKLSNDILESACHSLYRRGPDYQAYRTFTHSNTIVHLIHTRLSIIDLDARSNQPFEYMNFVIIFNGEIYNYKEIRAKLEELGYTFKTTSDTEVFIISYAHYGAKCFDYFEGMWSAVIFDQKTGKICISRDRFGEKPLFYIKEANSLFFASEINALQKLYSSKLEINYDQIFKNLTCGFRSLYKSDDTYFKNVKEFPASCYFELDNIDNFTIKPIKYWVPEFKQNVILSVDDAIEGTREHLIRSLKLRLRADVPIAFCLSGGIDSAGLVSIAKKIFNQNVSSYSIIDSDPRYNEQSLINKVSSDCDIESKCILLNTDNFINRLTNLIQHRATPVATISYYVHSLLMEEIARDHKKVVMSGTGADEIFTGYYDHFLLHAVAALNAGTYDINKSNWNKNIAKLVRNPELLQYDRYIINPNSREHVYLQQLEFENFLKVNFHYDFFEHLYCKDLLRNRMANELFHEIVPVILYEDDANSMYYSLENRSPFLDRELYEFVTTIPSVNLIQKGYAKYILREALNGILCDQVRLNHEKKGFNASILSVFDISNPELRDWLLADGPIMNLIRKDKLEELLGNSYFANSMSKFLFNIINTKIFLDTYS